MTEPTSANKDTPTEESRVLKEVDTASDAVSKPSTASSPTVDEGETKKASEESSIKAESTDVASEDIVSDGTTKFDDASKTKSAEAKTPLSTGGDGHLAALQLNNVLGKTRTREDLEVETKKLRTNLSNMRRRLNVAQDNLNNVKVFVSKHVENCTPEFRSEWQAVQDAIKLNTETVENEVEEGGGRRLSKGVWAQRRQTKKQKARVAREQHMLVNPKQNKLNGHSVKTQLDVVMQSGGTTSPSGKRSRNKRGGAHNMEAEMEQRMTGMGGLPRGGPPAVRQETAAQMTAKAKIRDELRAATTSECLSAVMEKAKAKGMKHEVNIAQRKLTTMKKVDNPQASVAGTTTSSADVITTVASTEAEPVKDESASQ